ncbi:hypothetical protein C8J57DRAFT_429920 [Mycena rebaudengoi]|nr:hypothetical protein C8J57DRAFT_429920 [Mycena rebaudengoi]
MIVGSGFRPDIPLALVYCNHHDKFIHCINTQLLATHGDQNPCRFLIHGGQFYIATQNKLAMDIYHVRTDSSSLQAMPSLPSSIRRVAQALHPPHPHFRYDLRSPRYDVFAVTVGSLLPDVTPIGRVYFWPAIDTGGAELTFGPTYSYDHDRRIDEMCVSASGRSAVIWSRDSPYSVGLIQYVALPTPHTTFRLLDIHPNVARLCGGFALESDDSLGILCINIPQDGTIAVFSFV